MLLAETKLCVARNAAAQEARVGAQAKVHSGRAIIFAYTIVLLALASLVASSMSAQETRATLSGTVFDPSSATIVGAMMKLTNVATGVSTTATSNTDGQYRFLFVDPGTYS